MTLLGYNLNIVYRAGTKNSANKPSRQPDYARAPEGCYTATILTEWCNTTFCLRQLYAAATQEDQTFEDVLPDTLTDLILEGQAEDHTVKEACMMLGLPGGYWPRNTAFRPHCYASSRVTGSSTMVSSTTECSCTFWLMDAPVWGYFAAPVMTQLQGILAQSVP